MCPIARATVHVNRGQSNEREKRLGYIESTLSHDAASTLCNALFLLFLASRARVFVNIHPQYISGQLLRVVPLQTALFTLSTAAPPRAYTCVQMRVYTIHCCAHNTWLVLLVLEGDTRESHRCIYSECIYSLSRAVGHE